MFKDDLHAAAAWADRTIAVAERLELLDVIADAVITEGTAKYYLGRAQESALLLRGALDLAKHHGLTQQQLRASNNLGIPLGDMRPREAWEVTVEALDVARKVGRRDYVFLLGANACLSAYDVGEWEWAEATTEELRQLLGPTIDINHLFLVRVEAMIGAAKGEFDAVRELVDAVVPFADEASDAQVKAMIPLMRSAVAMAEGDLRQAYVEGVAAAEVFPGWGPDSLGYAGRAAFWTNDSDSLEQVIRNRERGDLRGASIAADGIRLRAGLAALEGRLQEAKELYVEAIYR